MVLTNQDMIFDVCNLSDKIGASYFRFILAHSGKYNVNHCCPNQKVIAPGNWATYLSQPACFIKSILLIFITDNFKPHRSA